MAKKTIKAQMKQRRDTKANWAATNPVLLDGELGIVSDDPNLYKVGDGATAWNDLPFRGFDGTLAQELGTSPNAVISQKIVSEKLTELESETQKDITKVAKSAYRMSDSFVDGSCYITPIGSQAYFSSNANLACFKKEVKEGEKYGVASIGGTNARGWALVDANMRVYASANPNSDTIDIVENVVVEMDGYLLVNTRIESKDISYILDYNVNLYPLLNDVQIAQEEMSLVKRATIQINQEDFTKGGFYITQLGEVAYFSANANFAYYKKAVKKGDIYEVATIGGANAKGWVLVDDNMVTLSTSEANLDSLKNSAKLIIEQDGYLIVHADMRKTDQYYINDFSIRLHPLVAEVENIKKDVLVGGAVPCMVNPVINFAKNDLKVLDIGNSYTEDSQSYVGYILDAIQKNTGFSLYAAIRGSGSFKSWYDCYKDADTRDYRIYNKAGDTLENVGGNGIAGDGSLFRDTLTNVRWDVIIIHQASGYANDFSQWGGHGDGGYLQELIQILRKTNPQATIGCLLTHSYRSSYASNTEKSSVKRWENIALATKQLKQNYGIDFIIPYGTAVQNLRASSLNDENEFSTDGTHMADGLADYTAACCYYQSLFAPRFGISILGNSFRRTSFDESVAGVLNINDSNALVAQKAAMLATYNMWEIMNPDEYDL